MPSFFLEKGGVSIDDSGPVARIEIDPDLYSEDVALRAAYWLGDRSHVHVAKDDNGRLVAEIRLKDGQDGAALTHLCGEFCNGLIDFALRARIASETQDIQAALLQRAFIELVPKRAGNG